MQGKAQNGGVYKGFDWYVGAYGGSATISGSPAATGELNTAWTRRSASPVARLSDRREQPG